MAWQSYCPCLTNTALKCVFAKLHPMQGLAINTTRISSPILPWWLPNLIDRFYNHFWMNLKKGQSRAFRFRNESRNVRLFWTMDALHFMCTDKAQLDGGRTIQKYKLSVHMLCGYEADEELTNPGTPLSLSTDASLCRTFRSEWELSMIWKMKSGKKKSNGEFQNIYFI